MHADAYSIATRMNKGCHFVSSEKRGHQEASVQLLCRMVFSSS